MSDKTKQKGTVQSPNTLVDGLDTIKEAVSQQSTQTAVSLAPATQFIALTPANSPRMNGALQNVLKTGTNPMQRLNEFIAATLTLTPVLSALIGNASVPKVSADQFDGEIKAVNDKIGEQVKMADEISKSIDAQMKELSDQRDLLRKPFQTKIVELNTERAAIATKRDDENKPLVDALNGLREKAVEQTLSILKLEGDDAKTRAVELVDTLLTINTPSHISISSGPKISSGEGRGSGKATKVKISKAGETHEFSSLNAARAHVYSTLKNGEQPKHQANADACEKYLTNNGWTVEHIA